jgi:multisubunit Na+/H+ antiporter MnhB subunit
VLPGLSLLLIALAFGLAALSRAGPDGRPPAARLVAAALAFIGFGAAFLTDPEAVLPLLEGSRRTP